MEDKSRYFKEGSLSDWSHERVWWSSICPKYRSLGSAANRERRKLDNPNSIVLKDEKLPEGKDEARKLRVRAARYFLMDEVLYKRGFSQPYLRCLALDEANYVLQEVHEGACGNHSGARSLIHKVVRAGHYWPTVQADAKAYVKVCDQCQRFSNVPRQPSEYLTSMMAPWPFAQ